LRRAFVTRADLSSFTPLTNVECSYAAFLSHYKAETASEARLLKTGLEARFDREVFLDSDSLYTLASLKHMVCGTSLCTRSALAHDRPCRAWHGRYALRTCS
jgi:hypothetical protein